MASYLCQDSRGDLKLNLNSESEFDTKLRQFYFTNFTVRHVAKYNSRWLSYCDLS